MSRPKSSLVISNSELEIPLRHKVVFAPAGSGKTHALSQRYIDLLKAEVPPERILTLTFTEKAAAEMKERIFSRLAAEDAGLHRFLRDNALKLRISTIHSFCLSLVRRFAPLLNLDPRVDVLSDSTTTWESAKYDVLMRVAEAERNSEDYARLMDLVTRNRTQGWGRLSDLFDSLFAKRVAVQRGKLLDAETGRLDSIAAALRENPVGRAKLDNYSHLFPRRLSLDALREVFDLLETNADTYRTGGGTPRIRGCSDEEQAWNVQMCEYRNLVATALWGEEFGQALDLFQRRFLAAYTDAKRGQGNVDYDDMEYLAWQVLRDETEWQNILCAFDEHTDHILVDEFQDTSFLQWGIIDKLTEEWRSGEGAKTDRGVQPTVFIVGDEKQSIYMFRDAKVEVFATAADKLEQWLGKDKLERETLEKNYRSLQSIIDFNNALFSRLMSPTSQTGPTGQTESQPWRTRYAPFTRARANTDPGRVELILAHSDANAAERRALEARFIARRIRSLVEDPKSKVQSPKSKVEPLQTANCKLQTTAPLTVYERQPDVPETSRPCEYKDIAILIRSRTHLGAYEKALREADIPFLVLGGAGFYAEAEVQYLHSLLAFLIDPTDDVSLYVTLRGPFFDIPERDLFFANSPSASSPAPRPSALAPFLWDRIKARAEPGASLAAAVSALDGWLAHVHREPLARILSRALGERKVWARFWEPQREANVRKFITIIEGMEAGGEHPLRILNALEQAGGDEAKADVRVEDQPGVQILTVHSAKGLQFPVVFLPGLDDGIRAAGSSGDKLVVEEVDQDSVLVSYIPESGIRKENPFHQQFVAKEYEEEKRVFYVACTRARDAMFLTGVWHHRAMKNTRLAWLVENLGLREAEDGFALEPELPGITCITPSDIPETKAPAPAAHDKKPAPRRHPRPSSLAPRPTPSIRAVTRNLASDFQRHGEDSVGLGEVIHKLLEEISNGTLTADRQPLTAEITRLLRLAGLPSSLSANLQSAISNLQSATAVWDIVRPRPDSFTELPIMYSDGATVHTGRIDRVIVTNDEVRLYDYKTFKVSKKEVPLLASEYYEGQLHYYEQACSRLYPGRKVSTFLIFTALPAIQQTS
jgi:ATP-dependent helicase/nuclease subunit A